MHHPLTALALLLAACSANTEPAMNNPQPVALDITSHCKDNPGCHFKGQDLWLLIDITNRGTQALGFPLAYLQKAGPVVQLIDRRSQQSTHLKRNLADHALQGQFTPIAPGGSLRLEWVVTAAELLTMGSAVDLDINIELPATLRLGDKNLAYLGRHQLHVAAP
jgi:hypothetical protein